MHCFHKIQISKRALAMLFALAVQGCAESYSAKIAPQSNNGYSEV